MIKKIAIVGPESTGKSTLSEGLAAHFNCYFVKEYAREYCSQLTQPVTLEDEIAMFHGQLVLEEEGLKKSVAEKKPFLFCDTMILSVQVWTQHVLKLPTPFVEDELKIRTYDLFLLCDIDLPWEPDPLREFPEPEMRLHFFNCWKKELENHGYPFELVSGSGEHRLKAAIKSIHKHFTIS